MRNTLLLLMFFFVNAAFADDWVYDFEDGKIPQRHIKHDLNLNGLQWVMYGVRISGDYSDYADGSKSARIYGAKMSMKSMPYFQLKENKPGGIGVVSFNYRANELHQTTQVAWIVQVSEDNGASWQTRGVPFTPTMTVDKYTVNINAKEAMIRIVRADYETFDYGAATSFASAFNIDNLSITDAKTVNPDEPVIQTEEVEIAFPDTYRGESSKKTLSLQYKNLTAPIKVTFTQDGNAFSSETDSVVLTDKDGNCSIDLVFTPTAATDYTAIVNFVSGETGTQVSLTGKGVRKPGVYNYSGGTGTAEDPYLISNTSDLEDLTYAVDKEQISYSDKHFRMTNDIDMADVKDFTPIGTNFGSSGTNLRAFSGTFDGNDHTIQNLRMVYSDKNHIGVALFGVAQNAEIKNLKIDNSYFEADAVVSAMVAVPMGSTIKNCHVLSNVEVNATKQAYAGGLIAGCMEKASTISECSSAAVVKCNNMAAGGIVGCSAVSGVVIEKSVNWGNISTNYDYAGGIIGYAEAGFTVNDCANMGNINSAGTVASGIVGLVSPNNAGPYNVSNSYNTGKIVSSDMSGVSPIIGKSTDDLAQVNVKNCYYNIDKFTETSTDNSTAMAEEEMKTLAFAGKLNDDRENGTWVWSANTNEGFPMPYGEGESPQPQKEHSVLVSDNITVPVHAYYRMYVKTFVKELADWMASGKKIAVSYISDNEEVVMPNGNVFNTLKTGTANVTMRMSKPKAGTLDTFDKDNIIDEVSFKVTVQDEVQTPIPTLDYTWGVTREDFIEQQTKEFNYELFTEEYWKLYPNVSEEDKKPFEIFYLNNFEFPIMMGSFHSTENTLYALTVVASSWERVQVPKVSPVCKWLLNNGFEYLGTHPQTGQWHLYNKSNQTEATCGMIFLQNASYFYFTLNYNPVSNIMLQDTMPAPEINVVCNGNSMKVTGEKHAGATVTLYSDNGQIISKDVMRQEGVSFSVKSGQLYLLKIDGCMAVKVLP